MQQGAFEPVIFLFPLEEMQHDGGPVDDIRGDVRVYLAQFIQLRFNRLMYLAHDSILLILTRVVHAPHHNA